MVKRIKTHIYGFDKLIEGGFPEGSNILLSGGPGTGKTIFSLQYLYNGILNDNEIGIYFTFEEKRKSLISQAKQFNWDLEKEEKRGKLKIISLGTSEISKLTKEDILEIIKSTGAKRIVIDSITTISYLTPENEFHNICEYSVKKFIYSFITKFREIENLTSIFISQKDEELSNRISQYLCDGIINIEYESLGGDFSRNLIIQKMRKTKNDEDLHPLEISKNGIKIHNLE